MLDATGMGRENGHTFLRGVRYYVDLLLGMSKKSILAFVCLCVSHRVFLIANCAAGSKEVSKNGNLY